MALMTTKMMNLEVLKTTLMLEVKEESQKMLASRMSSDAEQALSNVVLAKEDNNNE
jgi:hypothetical protein